VRNRANAVDAIREINTRRAFRFLRILSVMSGRRPALRTRPAHVSRQIIPARPAQRVPLASAPLAGAALQDEPCRRHQYEDQPIGNGNPAILEIRHGKPARRNDTVQQLIPRPIRIPLARFGEQQRHARARRRWRRWLIVSQCHGGAAAATIVQIGMTNACPEIPA